MKQKVLLLLEAIGVIVLLCFGFTKSSSADFQANNLIDDSTFTNVNSMTANQIDAFLNNNFPSSCISTNSGFTAPDPTGYSPTTGFTYGSDVSAGKVIYDAAQAYGLNPQVILATLEKEESLVSGSNGCSTLQYSAALGNDCPDGGSYYNYSGIELYSKNGVPVTSVSGTCVNSADSVGFSRQVITATWKLMFWQQHAIGNVNWAVIKTNWDNSDDVGACYSGPMTEGYYKRCASDTSLTYFDGYYTIDSTNVHMDTGATAALYYYTPHFHGNELFENAFQSWFGPTTGEGYVLATSYDDNGDTRQWVIYQGERHLVPSTDVLTAWGLNNQTLLQWPGTYLGSYTQGPDLSRLMRPDGTQDVYFVDNTYAYKVTSPQMLAAWNFNPAAITDVADYLGQLPANAGNLTYAVRDASVSNGPVYTVDGGTLRQYDSPDILDAWEGDNAPIIAVSDAYISNMGTGASISGTKISDGQAGATLYQVDSGQKLAESSAVDQLYPGTAQTVSDATINRLVTSAPASQFVRAQGTSTVYMVDNSTKHPVASPDYLRAWGVGANPLVDLVTQGNLNLLANGSTIDTYEATDPSGNLYLMDGRAISVPSSLNTAYNTSNAYSASSALLSLSPNGGTATDFLKSFNSDAVYLMDAGQLRLIMSPSDLSLWDSNESITDVSDYLLGQFSTGGGVGSYVTDGTNEYFIEGGKTHLLASSVKANWGVSNPATLNPNTISRFTTGIAVPNQVQYNGQYYLIHEGTAFMTVDQNVAGVWNVINAPTMNSVLVREYLPVSMMTPFAKSKISGDSRIFAVDNGVLYYLSPSQATNLGVKPSTPLMAVDPSAITTNITNWAAILVQDTSGREYVIDGGTKRYFPNAATQNYWTNNGTVSATTLTNGFLDLLPTSGAIERGIQGTTAPVYEVIGVQKDWITNPSEVQTYSPIQNVSDALINVLPDGPNV